MSEEPITPTITYPGGLGVLFTPPDGVQAEFYCIRGYRRSDGRLMIENYYGSGAALDVNHLEWGAVEFGLRSEDLRWTIDHA